MNIQQSAEEMQNILSKLEMINNDYQEMLNLFNHSPEKVGQLIQGKPFSVYQEEIKRKFIDLLHQLSSVNDQVLSLYSPQQLIEPPTTQQTPVKTLQTKDKKLLTKLQISSRQRKKYLKEITADRDHLKELKNRSRKKIEPALIIHKPSTYAKIANTLFSFLSSHSRNKNWYKHLHHLLGAASIPMLTPSYISSMILSTLLAFILGLLITPLILLGVNAADQAVIVGAFGGAFLLSLITFIIFSIYPSLRISQRKRMIKTELPFVTIHLAAIASSGAKPSSLFKLLLNSHEYPGIEPELRKIVNMLNLFGYDITTTLKSVALTTPSKPFRDLLTGIASTIESGGSLKDYLASMATDNLSTYKIERKKFGETIATYSDIYTGILIAAPLLFVVALAIINILGGSIAGIPLQTAALLGTYLIIPLLNVGFYLFLSIVYPEA